jgi:signal peptidase II
MPYWPTLVNTSFKRQPMAWLALTLTLPSLVALEALLIKPWVLSQATLLSQAPLVLLPHVLALSLAHNRGVAFSALHGLPSGYLQVATGLLLGVLVLWAIGSLLLHPRRQPWWVGLAWGLTLGGGTANWLDRTLHGYVTDYLLLLAWPNFAIMNLGDWALSLGVALLVLQQLLGLHSTTRN